jgi:hypothetical protein
LAEWYGMQYQPICHVINDIQVSPITLSMPATCTTCNVRITGCSSNAYSVACSVPWVDVNPSTGVASPTGALSQVTASLNIGAARTGIVCYIPATGTTKCVDITQAVGVSPYKTVSMLCSAGGSCEELCVLSCGAMAAQPAMSVGERYNTTFTWDLSKPSTPFAPTRLCAELWCNGITIGSCAFSTKLAKLCTGTWGPFAVNSSDVFTAMVCAEAETTAGMSSVAAITITNVTEVVGSFCLGTYPYMTALRAETCSTLLIM